MDKREPKSFATIYSEAIESVGMGDVFAEQQASYLWTEIVGPGVNKLTTRRYVQNGVLHVYITSAALKNELMFHRSTIIDNINARVGRKALREIVFH